MIVYIFATISRNSGKHTNHRFPLILFTRQQFSPKMWKNVRRLKKEVKNELESVVGVSFMIQQDAVDF